MERRLNSDEQRAAQSMWSVCESECAVNGSDDVRRCWIEAAAANEEAALAGVGMTRILSVECTAAVLAQPSFLPACLHSSIRRTFIHSFVQASAH